MKVFSLRQAPVTPQKNVVNNAAQHATQSVDTFKFGVEEEPRKISFKPLPASLRRGFENLAKEKYAQGDIREGQILSLSTKDPEMYEQGDSDSIT